MGEKEPKKRDMDGIYFRVKRDGKWTNRCWTDLTDWEREEFGKDRPASWWQSVAEHLTKQLRYVSDYLDLSMVEGDEA